MAEMVEPGTIIILEFPIRRSEKEEPITEFTIQRRLKAKDFKGIQANNIRFDDMLKLISRMVAQPVSVVEEMDATDMMKLVEVVNSFLPDTQTDGVTG